jgi:hypothetical protein
MSFCVYTVLYTLEDKKPEENEYVQMFLLWFAQMAKVGTAKTIHLFIDSVTLEYMKQTSFNIISERIQCNLSIMEFPPPKTHLDGMKMKYTEFEYEEDYLMYMDIDILVLKPLVGLLGEGGDDVDIYLDQEGDIEEHGYMDALTEDERAIILNSGVKHGFSAGKFIIRNKEMGREFFREIREHISNNPGTTYYSVEQPVFNRTIFCMSSHLNMSTMESKLISTNFRNFMPETVLLDFCGEPGNGQVHLNKMINGVVGFT